LSRIALLMTSQGGQRGGAAKYPTDDMFSRAGVETPRLGVSTPNFDIPAIGDRLTGVDTTPVRRTRILTNPFN
jgi:hypothetical protein